MDGFEAWAREEIARLRGEADHLDRTLGRYLASKGSRHSAPNMALASVPSILSLPPRKRASKNDAILAAIDAAGPNGLSLSEIQTVAAGAGINSDRNVLRSFCWTEKQRGRLFQPETARFASIAHQRIEAADPTLIAREPAASAVVHNQHREGDAGGGT